MSIASPVLDSRTAAGPMLPCPALVRGIQPEAAGVATFKLVFEDPADAAAYRFRPGQFNMLYLPGFGEVAISLSSDPNDTAAMGHTIRYAGNVTQAFSRLKMGAYVGVRGPFGSHWPVDEAHGKNLVLVAGGIGLAPLRPAILSVLRDRKAFDRVVLLYGARTPADLLYRGEYARWEQQGLELNVTVDITDPQWRGQVGVVPQMFYRLRMDYKRTVVMSCGPEIMMRFVIYEALARRAAKQAIYLSLERNMKCAVGFCGHCQYGSIFICKQGPVMSFAAIEPFFGKEDF